ncbi:MAG: GNAT family N-acetyltransferase [Kangiellaceae bacterium]|nr:GNAT family N-acetyltransferase [Kangiellaceae bacterium]
MKKNLTLVPLEMEHFQGVIDLGNLVHGAGYLTDAILQSIYQKGLKDGINCSFVMLDQVDSGDHKVVGFRLTYAPTNWKVDEWCSPDLWKLPIEQLCYFKSSTVDADYRGHGVAKTMLKGSVDAAKKQGASGGICHTWMQSPGNAAYHYFVKCGGEHLKTYPNRWLEDSYAGYRCIVCGADEYCHCDAGEMILYFETLKG